MNAILELLTTLGGKNYFTTSGLEGNQNHYQNNMLAKSHFKDIESVNLALFIDEVLDRKRLQQGTTKYELYDVFNVRTDVNRAKRQIFIFNPAYEKDISRRVDDKSFWQMKTGSMLAFSTRVPKDDFYTIEINKTFSKIINLKHVSLTRHKFINEKQKGNFTPDLYVERFACMPQRFDGPLKAPTGKHKQNAQKRATVKKLELQLKDTSNSFEGVVTEEDYTNKILIKLKREQKSMEDRHKTFVKEIKSIFAQAGDGYLRDEFNEVVDLEQLERALDSIMEQAKSIVQKETA